MKGGALCRPTMTLRVQQPGRERPRSPCPDFVPAPSGGRSRPACCWSGCGPSLAPVRTAHPRCSAPRERRETRAVADRRPRPNRAPNSVADRPAGAPTSAGIRQRIGRVNAAQRRANVREALTRAIRCRTMCGRSASNREESVGTGAPLLLSFRERLRVCKAPLAVARRWAALTRAARSRSAGNCRSALSRIPTSRNRDARGRYRVFRSASPGSDANRRRSPHADDT
jgi:hypothetical protein